LYCGLLPWPVPGARRDQYTFHTFDYPGAVFTAGFTISFTGQIGGVACTAASCQGYLFSEGSDPVPIVPPGATFSYVTGIQRGGWLVSGHYVDAAGNSHGYVWDRLHPAEFTVIDPDPQGVQFTEVADMNPGGDLAGYYVDLAGAGHGYVLRKGLLTPFDIPGASFTAAFGINPAGDLVGTYCDAAGCHAYFLQGGINGALTTIDVPGATGTDAFGVNAIGQVVGQYCVQDGTCHAYVRNPDGPFVAVDPPGAASAIAFAIDPTGRITGVFCETSGSCHAFIATPQHGSDATEPGILRFSTSEPRAPALQTHSRPGKYRAAESLRKR
jgi:uncharacterized membrane protein